MVDLIFRCGHQQQVDVDRVKNPRCLECGESRIARTVNVGRPTFVGCVRGPCAETKALPAIAVSLAETPLPLKATDAKGTH